MHLTHTPKKKQKKPHNHVFKKNSVYFRYLMIVQSPPSPHHCSWLWCSSLTARNALRFHAPCHERSGENCCQRADSKIPARLLSRTYFTRCHLFSFPSIENDLQQRTCWYSISCWYHRLCLACKVKLAHKTRDDLLLAPLHPKGSILQMSGDAWQGSSGRSLEGNITFWICTTNIRPKNDWIET